MYKVFGIENIVILKGVRWVGAEETVRKSIDGTQFITKLKTGVDTKEEEDILSHSEAINLMNTTEWLNTNEI